MYRKKYITDDDKHDNTNVTHLYDIVVFICDIFFSIIFWRGFPIVFETGLSLIKDYDYDPFKNLVYRKICAHEICSFFPFLSAS